MKKIVYCFILLLSLVACQKKPKIYRNDKLCEKYSFSIGVNQTLYFQLESYNKCNDVTEYLDGTSRRLKSYTFNIDNTFIMSFGNYYTISCMKAFENEAKLTQITIELEDKRLIILDLDITLTFNSEYIMEIPINESFDNSYGLYSSPGFHKYAFNEDIYFFYLNLSKIDNNGTFYINNISLDNPPDFLSLNNIKYSYGTSPSKNDLEKFIEFHSPLSIQLQMYRDVCLLFDITYTGDYKYYGLDLIFDINYNGDQYLIRRQCIIDKGIEII